MSSGISRRMTSAFHGDASVISRFDLFARCRNEVLGVDADPDLLRVRSEVLICGLNRAAQALVTMSGYSPGRHELALVQAGRQAPRRPDSSPITVAPDDR
ncbi:MAG: hypothetical protein R2710_08420 [Acidimicrobiales bacterium]